MERAQFRGEWVEVLDEKGRDRFEIYCHPKLRAYIEALPNRGKHVLAKTLRQPLGYDAIEKAFRAWRATLGDKARPYSLHGLRKVAIIRLAEAGCTDAQIQAITNQKFGNGSILPKAGVSAPIESRGDAPRNGQ